eukprot:Ihof_evm3s33 gene=Ihof_evmTU3s33
MPLLKEEQLAQAKNIGNFDIEFQGDKEIYYEDDEIYGTFIATHIKNSFVFSKLRAVLICDVTYKDSLGLPWSERLLAEAIDIKTNVHSFEPGTITSVDFFFKIPKEMPATLAIKFIEARGAFHRGVTWSIRVVSQDPKNTSQVLVAKEFYKGALYETSLPPKGEAVYSDITTSHELTVMASLSKNVYGHNEPIDILLTVDNGTASQVKNALVTVYQKVSFSVPQKKTASIKKQIVAEMLVEEGFPLKRGQVSNNYYIIPKADPTNKLLCLRCSSQGENSEHHKAQMLSPSVTYYDHRTDRPGSMRMHFSVVYTIRVKLNLGRLKRYLSVTLPFTLSDISKELDGSTPRPHHTPTYHLNTSRSFLRTTKAKVEAVQEYGNEIAYAHKLEAKRIKELENTPIDDGCVDILAL